MPTVEYERVVTSKTCRIELERVMLSGQTFQLMPNAQTVRSHILWLPQKNTTRSVDAPCSSTAHSDDGNDKNNGGTDDHTIDDAVASSSSPEYDEAFVLNYSSESDPDLTQTDNARMMTCKNNENVSFHMAFPQRPF